MSQLEQRAELASFVPETILRSIEESRGHVVQAPQRQQMQTVCMFIDIAKFTILSETLARKGPAGIEQLGYYLNRYMESIIKILSAHGGDVVKFAGDAMLVLWSPVEPPAPLKKAPVSRLDTFDDLPSQSLHLEHSKSIMADASALEKLQKASVTRLGSSDPDAPTATTSADVETKEEVDPIAAEPRLLDTLRRAAQCALTITGELTAITLASDVQFSVKIGLGVGQGTMLHVGGVFNRMEYLASGPALKMAFGSEHSATAGDVVLPRRMHEYLKPYVSATPIPDTEHVKLTKVLQPLIPKKLSRSYRLQGLNVKEKLLQYVPAAVLPFASLSGQDKFWSAELRNITVMFINLGIPQEDLNAVSTKRDSLYRVQDAICAVQDAVYEYEGSLNKFLIDDKGSTVVSVFGLPRVVHEDDPSRAVVCALTLYHKLKDLKLKPCIGITTGLALCGLLGSASRREYSVLGDVVNLAARYMAAAKQHGILCGAATAMAVDRNGNFDVRFERLPRMMVKGKSLPVYVYSPKLDPLPVQSPLRDMRSHVVHLLQNRMQPAPSIATSSARSGSGPFRSPSNKRTWSLEDLDDIFNLPGRSTLLRDVLQHVYRVVGEQHAPPAVFDPSETKFSQAAGDAKDNQERSSARSNVLMFTGPPGVGKSTLLSYLFCLIGMSNEEKMLSAPLASKGSRSHEPYILWAKSSFLTSRFSTWRQIFIQLCRNRPMDFFRPLLSRGNSKEKYAKKSSTDVERKPGHQLPGAVDSDGTEPPKIHASLVKQASEVQAPEADAPRPSHTVRESLTVRPSDTNQQRLSQCFGRYLGAYSHKAHLVNLYLGTNFPTDSEQDSEQAASAEDQKLKDEEIERQAFELLFHVLEQAAPVVVLLDECNFMSSTDWLFCQYVTKRLNDNPSTRISLLMASSPLEVSTYQPRFATVPAGYSNILQSPITTRFEMPPLKFEHVMDMLCVLWSCDSVDFSVVENVMRVSSGNPLFVLKYAEVLAGRGHVLPSEKRVTVPHRMSVKSSLTVPSANDAEPSEQRLLVEYAFPHNDFEELHVLDMMLPVPFSVTRILTTLFDRVSKLNLQLLLKVACILCQASKSTDRSFTVAYLRELHPMHLDEDTLEEAIAELVKLGLLVVADDEDEYQRKEQPTVQRSKSGSSLNVPHRRLHLHGKCGTFSSWMSKACPALPSEEKNATLAQRYQFSSLYMCDALYALTLHEQRVHIHNAASDLMAKALEQQEKNPDRSLLIYRHHQLAALQQKGYTGPIQLPLNSPFQKVAVPVDARRLAYRLATGPRLGLLSTKRRFDAHASEVDYHHHHDHHRHKGLKGARRRHTQKNPRHVRAVSAGDVANRTVVLGSPRSGVRRPQPVAGFSFGQGSPLAPRPPPKRSSSGRKFHFGTRTADQSEEDSPQSTQRRLQSGAVPKPAPPAANKPRPSGYKRRLRYGTLPAKAFTWDRNRKSPNTRELPPRSKSPLSIKHTHSMNRADSARTAAWIHGNHHRVQSRVSRRLIRQDTRDMASTPTATATASAAAATSGTAAEEKTSDNDQARQVSVSLSRHSSTAVPLDEEQEAELYAGEIDNDMQRCAAQDCVMDMVGLHDSATSGADASSASSARPHVLTLDDPSVINLMTPPHLPRPSSLAWGALIPTTDDEDTPKPKWHQRTSISFYADSVMPTPSPAGNQYSGALSAFFSSPLTPDASKEPATAKPEYSSVPSRGKTLHELKPIVVSGHSLAMAAWSPRESVGSSQPRTPLSRANSSHAVKTGAVTVTPPKRKARRIKKENRTTTAQKTQSIIVTTPMGRPESRRVFTFANSDTKGRSSQSKGKSAVSFRPSGNNSGKADKKNGAGDDAGCWDRFLALFCKRETKVTAVMNIIVPEARGTTKAGTSSGLCARHGEHLPCTLCELSSTVERHPIAHDPLIRHDGSRASASELASESRSSTRSSYGSDTERHTTTLMDYVARQVELAEYQVNSHTLHHLDDEENELEIMVFRVVQVLRDSGVFIEDLSPPSATAVSKNVKTMYKTQLTNTLLKLKHWSFDVFVMEELTGGKPLLLVALSSFNYYNLLSRFEIPPLKFALFVERVVAHYNRKGLAFHSTSYVTDCLHALVFFLHVMGLHGHLTDLDMLALFLAALVHDLARAGPDPLEALDPPTDSKDAEYGGHADAHLAVFQSMMDDPQINILQFLTPQERIRFDALLRSLVQVASADHTTHVTLSRRFKDRVLYCTRAERDLDVVMQLLFKCSTLVQAARPFELYSVWVGRMTEEYFRMGDLYRKHKFTVPRHMDRNSPSVATFQLSWIKLSVFPFFRLLSRLSPGVKQFCLPILDSNQKLWELNKEEKKWSGALAVQLRSQLQALASSHQKGKKVVVPKKS